MLISFWLLTFVIVYVILGYPVTLLVIGKIRNLRVIRDESLMLSVNMVIPVHNGENEIKAKIDNCLQLDYPKELLKIFIVSDASTDKTNEIVKPYGQQVELVELSQRSGKVAAQNQVFHLLENDITVFTDVSIKMSGDALKNTIRNFADTNIGIVSCRDRIIGEKHSNAESLYIKYDMTVRRFLNRSGTLIGVTGGYFAIRTLMLNTSWKPEVAPDFFAALLAIRIGYRAIEDPDIIAEYKVTKNTSDEYNRKVRTITRGIYTLFNNTPLLNPVTFPLVSWQLLSHKLLRWMLPVFLLGTFVTSALIVFDHPDVPVLYSLAFVLQLVFWLLAVVGMNKQLPQNFVTRMAASFLYFNVAILKNWQNFFTGNSISIWNPTVR